MQNSNQLLVIIDPYEPSDHIVQRAIELAQCFDADLQLFACHHKSLGIASAVLKTEIFHQMLFDPISKIHAHLEGIADKIRAHDIDVSIDVVCDAPLHEAIVRKVLRDQPRWVVKDVHQHTLLHDVGLNNTDWNLIRECPCPLWLVRSLVPIVGSRVLAAVDPSHEHDKPASLDKKILSLAQLVSEQTQSSLDVIHTYNPAPAFMVTPGVEAAGISAGVLLEQMQTIHAQALDELVREFNFSEKQIHLEAGPTRKTICRFVEDHKIGLVVMGSIARNPLKRIFIGSSAEDILHSLPCDMLILKPDWFMTTLEKTPYPKDLDIIKDRKWGLKCT